MIRTEPALNEFLVLAGRGSAADWYRNLQATPAVQVAIGRNRFRPVHRILNLDEAVATLADYERRNRWITPLIRKVLSWLVGWRYDGSNHARQRLVRELPHRGVSTRRRPMSAEVHCDRLRELGVPVGQGFTPTPTWGPLADHTSCTDANNLHVDRSRARCLDPV